MEIAGERCDADMLEESGVLPYGALWGRGAGGVLSPSGTWIRAPFPKTPACEKGYKGTPMSRGCF